MVPQGRTLEGYYLSMMRKDSLQLMFLASSLTIGQVRLSYTFQRQRSEGGKFKKVGWVHTRELIVLVWLIVLRLQNDVE